MGEGFDNIEGHHFCNDSSYKHTVEVSVSSNGVYSGNEDKRYGDGSTEDALELESYQFEPTSPVHDSASNSSSDEEMKATDWRLRTPNAWCTNTLRNLQHLLRTLKMQEICR